VIFPISTHVFIDEHYYDGWFYLIFVIAATMFETFCGAFQNNFHPAGISVNEIIPVGLIIKNYVATG
jgi:hypothetical protein